MISYLSSIVTMSLSCTISEILSLTFQNLKTSRDCDYPKRKIDLGLCLALIAIFGTMKTLVKSAEN